LLNKATVLSYSNSPIFAINNVQNATFLNHEIGMVEFKYRESFLLLVNLGVNEKRRVGKGSLGSHNLDIRSVVEDGSLSKSLLIVQTSEFGESPLVADHEFLSSGEFVLSSSEGLEGFWNISFFYSH